MGLNGTIVEFPHAGQIISVSSRTRFPLVRFALHRLQYLGPFLNCLAWKKSCSPALNTNSAPHSEHFRTLSWYSMEAFPLDPKWWERADFCTMGRENQQGLPGSGSAKTICQSQAR